MTRAPSIVSSAESLTSWASPSSPRALRQSATASLLRASWAQSSEATCWGEEAFSALIGGAFVGLPSVKEVERAPSSTDDDSEGRLRSEAKAAAQATVEQYQTQVREAEKAIKESSSLDVSAAERGELQLEVVSDALDGIAVPEALRKRLEQQRAVEEQTVWDTTGNSVAEVASDLKFNPTKEINAQVHNVQLSMDKALSMLHAQSKMLST